MSTEANGEHAEINPGAEIDFQALIPFIQNYLRHKGVGSVNAEILLDLLGEQNNPLFDYHTKQQLVGTANKPDTYPLAPCFRDMDSFSIGQQVMFRQPHRNSQFIESAIRRIDERHVELDWGDNPVITLVPHKYIGIFDKADYDSIKNRSKGGGGRCSTNAAFIIRLSEMLDPETDIELARQVARHFNVLSMFEK